MKEEWSRRPGESAKAYAAFLVYRDIGPERSVDKCFAPQSAGSKQAARLAARRGNGRWFLWCSEFGWVERAVNWDDHIAREQEKHFERRLKQLAHEQADFAVQEFKRLVERVRKADRILDKADGHPITDIDQESETVGQDGRIVKKRNKVKGVNFAGYAALMKEIRESARRAIIGPREDVDGDIVPEKAGDFVVAGPE